MATRAEIKAQTLQIIGTFGERMKFSRELCGLSGINASKMLGYDNSSKLSKVELASDTNSVPLWLIPKAAEVYGVSADFLLGLSDHWQRDPERVQQAQMENILEHATKAQDEAIRSTYSQISFLSNAVVAANTKVGQIKATLKRFAELNPGFEDMKCGARLVRLINEANQETSRVANSLNNGFQ
ncbi:helix-turn-helix domain-containing protein [Methylomonas methanica]|uniref:XRE family transcriptional regulator n=1 Tax=Methylomonas methanica (strain DSM 25384 / MC09) TaxID=857087 RepID=G0A3T2_METMM|nr:helix-turn-helix transcriptional regulator [Methylomonas methanica]AEG02704.1 XRE family transcriptional regulator [Methylomonas methanica MC09]